MEDFPPASPSSLLGPSRKRARIRPLDPQQLQPQDAVGQPQSVTSPYASAPPALFISEGSGLSPQDPLSPHGGRLRRSSVMSSATVVSCLPPISPLDLGGFEGQQRPRQHAAAPLGRPGLALSLGKLDVDLGSNGGPGAAGGHAAGGGLTPHLNDVLSPGRLLLGSPVDLGDGLERAVDVAAEFGLIGTPGPDVCGLLASPDYVLASPRGVMLASLRDVMLASPLGKAEGFGPSSAGFGPSSAGFGPSSIGRGGAFGGLDADGRPASQFSPLATPLFAGGGQQRHSWARRDSRARSSLLSASTPQPELSAWVPCSGGAAGGAGAGGGAGGGSAARDVQPPWLSAAGQQQVGGVFSRTIEVQRGTCKGASHRPLGRRGNRAEQRQRGGGDFGLMMPPHQDDRRQLDQRQPGAGAERPWSGRHGVPMSIVRELQGGRRAEPAYVMLDSIERVWASAGRHRPAAV
jgi:hypothetical protein